MTKINWHRLFGLTLMDLFTGSNYQVELEKELSLKKQYLDIVIIKKTTGQALKKMPAGLENLAEHNLLTYKSLQEPLDDWAIEELIGYYSNYRKIVSPSLDKLLPANLFKLYAISTRHPYNLLNKKSIFKKIQTGVFDLTWGSRLIRIIVLSRMPQEKKNALWQIFSGKAAEFAYGNQNYNWHCFREKAVINQLYELYYKKKGVIMPYTMADFNKDFTREHLDLLQPEERLKGLSSETVFQQFPLEERLKGLPSETVFQQFPAEVIEKYLSKLKKK